MISLLNFAFKHESEEALAQGIEKGLVSTAQAMLADNMAPDLVSKYTGLSLEAIAALSKR